MSMLPDFCSDHKKPSVQCKCCTMFYCDEFYRGGFCPGCQGHKERGHAECGGAAYRAEQEADPNYQRYKKIIEEQTERRISGANPTNR